MENWAAAILKVAAKHNLQIISRTQKCVLLVPVVRLDGEPLQGRFRWNWIDPEPASTLEARLEQELALFGWQEDTTRPRERGFYWEIDSTR